MRQKMETVQLPNKDAQASKIFFHITGSAHAKAYKAISQRAQQESNKSSNFIIGTFVG